MISFQPFQNIKGAFAGRNKIDVSQAQSFVLLKQVHGDRIHVLKPSITQDAVHLQEGDALLCFEKNIPVAVKTADCVPILLAHPDGIVGAVHAGWRGTRLKILEKVLIKIRDEFKKDLSKIHLAIGPAICGECYEVGEEVAKEFQGSGWTRSPRAGHQIPFILSSSKDQVGKYFLNLKLANQFIAENCGIPTHHITVHPDCTLCNPQIYHSYRYESQKGLDKEGRNYSWVMRS